MFQQSKNINIHGGNFTVVHGDQSINRIANLTPFERLEQAIASSAIHNSYERFDPPKCHPRTRTAVLERIHAWAHSAADTPDPLIDSFVMWLHGQAGAGKSAIAQTTAEQFDAASLLLASFFFNRGDPSRNHGRNLVPTIAYQIAKKYPLFRRHLEESIDHDPVVFKYSIEAQFLSLVVMPLKALLKAESPDGSSGSSIAQLVVIDGLDECQDHDIQCNIVAAIANTARKHRLPLIFLIASRPEAQIADAFNSSKVSDLLTRLQLNDVFRPDEDIKLFLQDSFDEIRRMHRLKSSIPHPWPTSKVLNILVRKASGQFIYASVVMKYVKSPRHHPKTRLDIILGLRPPLRDMPFAELDALYMHIFRTLDNIDTALQILTYLFCQDNEDAGYKRVKFISRFLDLDPDIVEVCLADLSSILKVENDVEHAPELRVLSISHASLSDFLSDPARSEEFHMHPSSAHVMMAQKCLSHIKNHLSGKRKIDPLNMTIFAYAIQNLTYHCKKSPIEAIRNEIYDFSWPSKQSILKVYRWDTIVQTFLDWLEGEQHFTDCYTQHLTDYHHFLGTQISAYYRSPRLTLLLAIVVEQDVLLKHTTSAGRLECIVDLDPASYIFDRDNGLRVLWRLGLGRTLSSHSARYELRRLSTFLGDHQLSGSYALDRHRYSIATLICLQYLCNHPKHIGVSARHTRHEIETRRNRPWMWHLMKRRGGPLERRRKDRRITFERDRRRYRRGETSPAEFAIAEKCRELETYVGALDLFLVLLQRSINAPGRFSSDFAAFSRRCTFGMIAMKFPRKTQAAKALITHFHRMLDTQAL